MEFIRIGKGRSGITVRLDDRFVSLSGLDHLPEAGDRLKVKGEVWEIVGVTDPPVATMVEWVIERVK